MPGFERLQSSWSSLPEELALCILHSLDTQSKLRAEQVCRDWRKVIRTTQEPDSWGPVRLRLDRPLWLASQPGAGTATGSDLVILQCMVRIEPLPSTLASGWVTKTLRTLSQRRQTDGASGCLCRWLRYHATELTCVVLLTQECSAANPFTRDHCIDGVPQRPGTTSAVQRRLALLIGVLQGRACPDLAIKFEGFEQHFPTRPSPMFLQGLASLLRSLDLGQTLRPQDLPALCCLTRLTSLTARVADDSWPTLQAPWKLTLDISQLVALQELRLAEVGSGTYGFLFHEDTKLPCLTCLQTLGKLHILPQKRLLSSLHSLEVTGPGGCHQELIIRDYHIGITQLKQLAIRDMDINANAGLIGFWSGLEELFISEVGFWEEPFEASWLTRDLPALRKLSIVRNGIAGFNVARVPRHLEHLDLEGNVLARVPENLQTLTCLTFLDLSCQQQDECRFKVDHSLTEWALAMPKLQVLDLSQCFGFEWDVESLYALAALENAFAAAEQAKKRGGLQFHWHTCTSTAD